MLHPGVVRTAFGAEDRSAVFAAVVPMIRLFMKTPQQGAATTVFAATSPLLEGIGGRYLEDVAEAPVVPRRDPLARGVAGYALDPVNAERLWDVSLRMVG